jgi:uncharacterized repeat protein (TIGR03803 family)
MAYTTATVHTRGQLKGEEKMRKISGRFSATAGITALMGMMLAAAIAAPAQTFTVVHSFDSGDGADPEAAPVQATDGNLYGTTQYGGANKLGTVFKITPSGVLTTLHTSDSTDGAHPEAALVQATDGNFYGTTVAGGANGDGTVFKITPSGTLTTLHSFDGTDGDHLVAGLVQATDGDLYGTTTYGGANYSCTDGCGTVFKITVSGTLTTLHSFDSTDGSYPDAALVQGTDGSFYGTTSHQGSNSCFAGCGTVFKITTQGTLTTLHSFDGADGERPGGLVQATDGNFYGTTVEGGAEPYGTVFKITASGDLTTLHSFDSADGAQPFGTLVQATDGNFYGTTYEGGANRYGTVFKITPSGTLTTLYNFCAQPGCTDGRDPFAGLVQDTNGSFYGTTFFGGANSDGTVFSLSVGLGPFVETLPTSGKTGAVVKVLGTDLTGATSVTFNGAAAVFKVISPSEIGTIVPSGATTGPVQVVAPSGTLTSNVNFRVE